MKTINKFAICSMTLTVLGLTGVAQEVNDSTKAKVTNEQNTIETKSKR